MSSAVPCRIEPVAKRRDGGTRFWCLAHHSDATLKYGKPAPKCRYADIAQPSEEEILVLDPSSFSGGIALWGAVPPVYDTTQLPIDRGIHVHARKEKGGPKVIDRTFRAVQLPASQHKATVTELDAIYFMVSSVLNLEMRTVLCSHCGFSHLDKDWFSVHPHKRHLCSGCGKNFSDESPGIGNPLIAVKHDLGDRPRKFISPERRLSIRQSDFPAGIQVWGSNAAIVWTSETPEEVGIHVHASTTDALHPDIDDTFSGVEIDGIVLDPVMVRTFMAQSSLPHLFNRVVAISCPYCHSPHFDHGNLSFTPHEFHICTVCGGTFRAKCRFRSTIGNPLRTILKDLAATGVRAPQFHDLGLLPETL